MEKDRPYKQYIIEYDLFTERLSELLKPYEHFRSTLAPYCAVTLYSKEQEESLLESIVNMEGIRYREALHRTALEKE